MHNSRSHCAIVNICATCYSVRKRWLPCCVFLTEAEILKELESENESDTKDDDLSDILVNNISDSDEDCDVSEHDSIFMIQ